MKTILLSCSMLLCVPYVAHTQKVSSEPMLVLDSGGHTSMIKKVLFTPDGLELITVSDDKTIRCWDAKTGEPLRVLRPPIGKGGKGTLRAAAISPDGKLLAVGGWGMKTYGDIYLISMESGLIKRVLQGHSTVISSLVFHPDGTQLLSGSADDTARIWNIANGRTTQVLRGHDDNIYAVTFSPKGLYAATASIDSTAQLWSVKTGRRVAQLKGHTQAVFGIAWSPDGKTIATGSEDQSIRLWDSNGSLRKVIHGLKRPIASLQFTPNSQQLLYTCGVIAPFYSAIIEIRTGKELVRFRGNNNTILSGAFSPDGKLVATVGGDDFDMYLWRRKNGKIVWHSKGKGRGVWACAWSKDGKTIAWGNTNQGLSSKAGNRLERTFNLEKLEVAKPPDNSYRRAQSEQGAFQLKKSGKFTVVVQQNGQRVSNLTPRISYDRVHCFTLLPNDRVVVGSDFALTLYNSRTGTRIKEFLEHTSVIWAVSPSPDNRYVLTGSYDQTLRIWPLDNDEPLLSLFFAGPEWVAWTPQGYYACSPGGERLMGWHINNGADKLATFHPASRFRKSLYRPDIIKLLLRTGSVAKAVEVANRAKIVEKITVAKVLPPVVSIISPSTGQKLNQSKIQVRAEAHSVGKHTVQSMQLLLDGRPYRGKAGIHRIDSPSLGKVTHTWDVELSLGKHRIQVLADSEVSEGVSQTIDVSYAGEKINKTQKPTLYVLAIGISKAYPEKLRLNYAHKDATILTETLKKVSKNIFADVKTKLITEKQATRRGILQGLSWLRKEMTQRDVGIFFFAGHGDKDTDDSLYFLPSDVDSEDLLTTGLSAETIRRTLSATPGRLIALLDACHSGGFEEKAKRRGGTVTDDFVRDLIADETGLIVMCSSMGKEFSTENNEHRHGTFTVALLEGIQGNADSNKDGVIYLHELNSYVIDRVKKLSKGRQHPTTGKPTSIRSFPLAKP